MLIGFIESYAVESQSHDFTGHGVEGVLTATVCRVVAWIQRREEGASLGDAVAEEIVRATGAVAAAGCRHLILSCTDHDS